MNERKTAANPEHEATADEAWRLADEAITTGSMTLKSGEIVKLEPKELLRVVQQFAAMSKRKPKGTPMRKDLFLGRTDAGEDA